MEESLKSARRIFARQAQAMAQNQSCQNCIDFNFLATQKKDIFADNIVFIQDLFVVELFSIFERFVRERFRKSVVSNDVKVGPMFTKIIQDQADYYKFDDLLDVLKNIVSPNTIGEIKQIKSYRDWVAHGRNQTRRPPAIISNIGIVHKTLETVMKGII